MQSLKGLSKGMLTSDSDIKRATNPVDMHAYKYTRGSVLILIIGAEWSGAGLMAARAARNALAALRVASGFVTVAAPEELFPMLLKVSPAFVRKKLEGSAAKQLKEIASVKHDVIIIGPGVQPNKTSRAFLTKLIKFETSAKRTIVIDAGVIGMIKGLKSLIKGNMIITPHDGEFRTLTGIDLVGKGIAARISAAKTFAKRHKCTVVLKGHETVIANPKRVKINIAKTPVLATMGTGDVLSGMIASYAAQHSDNFESAVAAVHLHSMIGSMLYRKKGLHITATDVIDAIPDALKRFDLIK